MPADGLVEGFRKMMRDLARDESKEIDFRVTNSGVYADRRVLDMLKDPLMHLLRNAVSHGIEPPRERVAKGKPTTGLVALRVGAEGQRLTITIEDDGRGVDLARVVEVAVRQGILSDADASHCSPKELGRILFRPGFSTSRVVTDLSGRGMGLSVVHEAVRRLQGNIDIDARDGCGTVLHLSVPLSIATHRLLIVGCGGQSFALPIQGIERVCRRKLQSVDTVEGKPVLLLDGHAVPLFSLQHFVRECRARRVEGCRPALQGSAGGDRCRYISLGMRGGDSESGACSPTQRQNLGRHRTRRWRDCFCPQFDGIARNAAPRIAVVGFPALRTGA